MKKKNIGILCSVLGALLVLGAVIGLGVALPVAPEPDNSQSNNVVAEIYIENETVPYKKVSRAEFEDLFSYRGDNIFKNDSYLQSVDIRIEILDNIKIGETELALYVGTGKDIEFNANGYCISADLPSAPMIRVYSQSTGGNVVFNDLEMHNSIASCLQIFNEVSVDLNMCYLTAGKQVLFFSDSCTLNINAGTILDGEYPIFAATNKPNTVNIAAGASLCGRTAAVLISKGNSFDFNVNGGVIKSSVENGDCVIVQKAEGEVNVDIDGAYLRGVFRVTCDANINLNYGKLYGSVVSDTVTVNVGEDFIIEPYEAEVTEVA